MWLLVARKGGKCISSWSNSAYFGFECCLLQLQRSVAAAAAAAASGEQAFELSVETEEETEEAVALWRHCSSSPLEARTHLYSF